MADSVIRVENLGKQYRIGVQEKAPQSLRQAVTSLVASPFKYLNTVLRPPTNEEIVWALKDVSFEVKQGEVIGVIGRNGAGKSTLLKILSRITEPTTGYAEIRGRVASLLEVGAGFHPELTGRENIYLNGTIMGMKKREIDRRFDEIVDFAGVEKYIDTPVKRYSSGMYVRLAFAVAAHLEPEILVVDEVLAVGDTVFQKKCLGKMEDVSSQRGKTIILVSHQMETIQALCSRVLLMQEGMLIRDGVAKQTLDYYLNRVTQDSTIKLQHRQDREGVGYYRYTNVWLTNANGETVSSAQPGEPININLQIAPQDIQPLKVSIRCSLGLHDLRGYRLFTLSNTLLSTQIVLQGETVIRWTLNDVFLYEGDYRCNVFMSRLDTDEVIDFIQDAFIFSVSPGDYFGTGKNMKDQGDKVFVKHNVFSFGLT